MSLMYIVFKNRTSTLLFYNVLRGVGVDSMIIDTPKKIMSSCGLSVETNFKHFKKVLSLLKIHKIKDFYGIFKINYGESYFEKIV